MKYVPFDEVVNIITRGMREDWTLSELRGNFIQEYESKEESFLKDYKRFKEVKEGEIFFFQGHRYRKTSHEYCMMRGATNCFSTELGHYSYINDHCWVIVIEEDK